MAVAITRTDYHAAELRDLGRCCVTARAGTNWAATFVCPTTSGYSTCRPTAPS